MSTEVKCQILQQSSFDSKHWVAINDSVYTLEDAQARLAAIKANYPHRKYRLKRLTADESQWAEVMAREYNKFYGSPYKNAVFHGDFRLNDLWAKHFFHVSEKNSDHIAYYENIDRALSDVYTTCTVRRYIQRFVEPLCGEYDSTRYLQQHIETFASVQLKFTTDPDEIVRVYTNGPGSCMSYAPERFAMGIHPTRAYGNSPNIALAYYENSEGRVASRCIVRTDYKAYGVIYGERAKMKRALTDAGYTYFSSNKELVVALDFDSDYDDADEMSWLVGGKLTAIPHTEVYGDEFIVPFVDGAGMADIDRDGFLVLVDCDGDIDCRNTSGSSASGAACTKCHKWCDCRTIDGVYRSGRYYNDRNWCEECYEAEVNPPSLHHSRPVAHEFVPPMPPADDTSIREAMAAALDDMAYRVFSTRENQS